MAAGLSSAQGPLGALLISINVKWCCPQANRNTHTHTSRLWKRHTHAYAREARLICSQTWCRLGCPRGKIQQSDAPMSLNDGQASGTFACLMLSMCRCCTDKTLFTFVRVELISFLPFTDCRLLKLQNEKHLGHTSPTEPRAPVCQKYYLEILSYQHRACHVVYYFILQIRCWKLLI